MSIKLMAAVFESGPTDPLERLVLLALADNANDEGHCWPTLPTIVAKTAASRATVVRKISALEADGWLSKVKRKKSGRDGVEYVISHSALSEHGKAGTVLTVSTDGAHSDTKWCSHRAPNHKEPSENRADPAEVADDSPPDEGGRADDGLSAKRAPIGLRNRWSNAVARQQCGETWFHPVFGMQMLAKEPVPSFEEMTELAIERKTRDGHIAETVRKIRRGNGCPDA